jgi:hypothetical protein
MKNKFKVGDKVSVKGETSSASYRLDGQICKIKSFGKTCKTDDEDEKYWYNLEEEGEITGGVWEDELALVKNYESWFLGYPSKTKWREQRDKNRKEFILCFGLG